MVCLAQAAATNSALSKAAIMVNNTRDCGVGMRMVSSCVPCRMQGAFHAGTGNWSQMQGNDALLCRMPVAKLAETASTDAPETPMAHPERTSLLRRLISRPEPVAVANDPADMGTAIGLDYTLDEAPLPGAADWDPSRPIRVIQPARKGWLPRRRG